MPISSTRITEVTGTTIELVAMPKEILFMWRPEDSNGRLIWSWLEHLVVDDVVNAKDFGRYGKTSRNWDDIKNLQPAYSGEVDPVTGADLTQISMRGVMAILQSAFDRAYEQDAGV